MAITPLTPLEVSQAGTPVVLSSANADGHYVPNDGKVFLMGKNADVSAHTVTVTPTAPQVGLSASTPTAVSVAAGAEFCLGPYPPQLFNDVQGRMKVTFDAVTSVTIAAVHVP